MPRKKAIKDLERINWDQPVRYKKDGVSVKLLSTHDTKDKDGKILKRDYLIELGAGGMIHKVDAFGRSRKNKRLMIFNATQEIPKPVYTAPKSNSLVSLGKLTDAFETVVSKSQEALHVSLSKAMNVNLVRVTERMKAMFHERDATLLEVHNNVAEIHTGIGVALDRIERIEKRLGIDAPDQRVIEAESQKNN